MQPSNSAVDLSPVRPGHQQTANPVHGILAPPMSVAAYMHNKTEASRPRHPHSAAMRPPPLSDLRMLRAFIKHNQVSYTDLSLQCAYHLHAQARAIIFVTTALHILIPFF